MPIYPCPAHKEGINHGIIEPQGLSSSVFNYLDAVGYVSAPVILEGQGQTNAEPLPIVSPSGMVSRHFNDIAHRFFVYLAVSSQDSPAMALAVLALVRCVVVEMIH